MWESVKSLLKPFLHLCVHVIVVWDHFVHVWNCPKWSTRGLFNFFHIEKHLALSILSCYFSIHVQVHYTGYSTVLAGAFMLSVKLTLDLMIANFASETI